MRPPGIRTRWIWPGSCEDRWGHDVSEGVDPLLDAAALAGFFEACYQASMLREEERPVVFRAILAEPTLEPEGGRPRASKGSRFPVRCLSIRGNSRAPLGSLRPAAYPHRGETGGGARVAYMGPGQLGYSMAEGRLRRQAGRGAATGDAGRPRQRAGEHRGVQGPRARRQAPKGKATRGRGWTPSSPSGCLASSPGSWRS